MTRCLNWGGGNLKREYWGQIFLPRVRPRGRLEPLHSKRQIFPFFCRSQAVSGGSAVLRKTPTPAELSYNWCNWRTPVATTELVTTHRPTCFSFRLLQPAVARSPEMPIFFDQRDWKTVKSCTANHCSSNFSYSLRGGAGLKVGRPGEKESCFLRAHDWAVNSVAWWRCLTLAFFPYKPVFVMKPVLGEKIGDILNMTFLSVP